MDWAYFFTSASSANFKINDVETALGLLKQYPENFVELRLILSAPLTSADSQALSANENLVSLLAEVRTEEELQFESRKGLSDEELFKTYYKSVYNAEPKEELQTLFLATLAETQES